MTKIASALTIKKGERLKSRKVIGQLFSEGKSFSIYPLRLIWCIPVESRSTFPVQFGVSVPKRRFPKAVTRNRIKRLLRESYRQHKSIFSELTIADLPQVGLMIIYIGKKKPSYQKVDEAMQVMLKKFVRKILENSDHHNNQLPTD